ncbi:MAG: phospholipase, partial [Synechococcus sp.]
MRPLPLVLALTLCCGCSQQSRLLGAPAPDLKNANGIDIAFNHRTNGRYRSPLTEQWRNGDDLEQL